MKKFVQIALMSALALTVSVHGAFAAEVEDDKGVSVTDINVVRAGDAAKVTFALHLGARVTAENRSLIIDPVLQNEAGKVSLYPIVVRGSRAQAANEERAMQMAELSTEMPYHTSNGRTVEYVATIPWESWMSNSDLVFNGISTGNGRVNEVAIGTVAQGLLADVADEPAAAPTTDADRNAVAAAILGNAAGQRVVQQPLGSAQTGPQTVTRPLGSAQTSAQSSMQASAQSSAQSGTQFVGQFTSQPGAQAPDARDAGVVVQRAVAQTAVQANSRTTYPAGNAQQTTQDYYIPTAPPAAPVSQIYSVGDELASRFMFVEPVAKYYEALRASSKTVFDYNMPITLGTGVQQSQSEIDRFIEMTRKGSVYIQFNLGSQIASRDLANNNRMMVDLLSSINLLESSADVRVSHVVIAGFSAPEGTFAENEKLALDRAAVARDLLTANTGIDPKAISVYNGSIDWTTLRALIAESNMPEKYTILNIIDNTPAWDTFRDRGRLERLMAVNGGMAYRYISEHFFPQLRQTGAYIKVYYENIR